MTPLIAYLLVNGHASEPAVAVLALYSAAAPHHGFVILSERDTGNPRKIFLSVSKGYAK
jgi:hypothetical protein